VRWTQRIAVLSVASSATKVAFWARKNRPKRMSTSRYSHFSPFSESIFVMLCYTFFFCVQKWERERLEKQKLQGNKVRAENDKNAAEKNEGTADKVHVFLFRSTHTFIFIVKFDLFCVCQETTFLNHCCVNYIIFLFWNLLLFLFHAVEITMKFNFQNCEILHDWWVYSFDILFDLCSSFLTICCGRHLSGSFIKTNIGVLQNTELTRCESYSKFLPFLFWVTNFVVISFVGTGDW